MFLKLHTLKHIVHGNYSHTQNMVHILSSGVKLDLQRSNSSRQITRDSSRKGKKREHMLVDSCIGCKEMLSYALDR